MYRQKVDGHELSTEKDTAAVPSDGYYYVRFKGEIVGRHRTLKAAQRQFSELKAGIVTKQPQVHKPSVAEVQLQIMSRMSNKELFWTEEDFVRVDRRTRGKKGTRSSKA